MTIETIDDLCIQIANWIGIYGACKASNDNEDHAEGCENENPLCCRVGFMIEMRERMIKAVENEKKLEQTGLL